MNKFQKRFESFDNRRLIEIMEDLDNYEPEAIEAASQELKKRGVGADEINGIKEEIYKTERLFQKRTEKVKNVGIGMLNSVNPVQEETSNVNTKIRLFVISFGLLAAYQIYQQFDLLKFLIFDDFINWDWSTIFIFLPIILLPIMVFLFWKRKKIGWLALTFFITFNFLSALGIIFYFLDKFKYTNSSMNLDFTVIVSAFFYLASLIIINNTEIKTVFGIEEKTAKLTMFSAFVLVSTIGIFFLYSL